MWFDRVWNSPFGISGSPADNDNLEIGDEILEVNGKTLEDANHTEVINHIHQVDLNFFNSLKVDSWSFG